MKMKSLSFTFLVYIFFLTIHINGDIESLKKCPNISNSQFRSDILNISVVDPEEIDLRKSAIIHNNNEEKGRLCLRNISRCYKDEDKSPALSQVSQIFLSSSAPFDLSQIHGVSPKCKIQSRQYVEDLKRFKLWALKIYDASAKLPSGILNGNINQLGDFDLCVQAENQDYKIKGQYCLASVQIEAMSNPYIAALQRLSQSHYHFKSRLEDPGHRVPRFSSINWALCVPSGCSTEDVKLGIKRKLQSIVKNTDLQFDVEVKPEMCQISKDKPLPMSTIIAIIFFTSVVLIVLGAAVYDYTALGEKNQWIMAFSLRKNLNDLFTTKKSEDDIKAIHIVRFLNAFVLLGAHKSMTLFFMPYTNRTEMVELLTQPWTVLGRAASLYTDPFIMISGTLTTYSLLGKFKKNGKINIFEEYASRLLRIVPTFAALIAFCTLVLPWTNTGPMWNLVVTQHSTICKKTWWRNLLFIHNYFGFKNICLTHTHHVGIDTQLFFVSPFLIMILWKWPKKGAITLVTIATISTLMRYFVTYTLKLSNYIHFGTSIQQLFDTADNMYILPAHRATVYIMGIFLGYILREYKTVTFSKAQIHIGDTVALACFFFSLFGPAFMGKLDYVYNPADAAWYAAFIPILWCLSFAWLIFTTQTTHRSVLEYYVTRPFYYFWTKISYTVYLTQFPVFFYNLGTLRTSEHYGFFRAMFNFKELGSIVVLSALLTLLFEMPFSNIRNILFAKKKHQSDTETHAQCKKIE